MAKRKLTKKQSWRIAKIQEEKAQRAQQKEAVISDQLNAGELGDEMHGQVIAHFGAQVEVEDNDRNTYRCFLRANLGSLVTGDKIVFRPAPANAQGVNQGVVEMVQPRDSELSRPNPYNEIKPVAANIDFIVLVIAPEPHAHANLIDRYLVAAENCHIEPIILLNKTDLLDDLSLFHLEPLLQRYADLGYRILQVCANEPESLGELKEFLNDRVSVFVGQSGVGKSSLIGTLLPGEELKVGPLSENTRKGKHTTTTARLYHFPAGGDLIDSPGIREFGLWHMSEDDVLYGFRELRALTGHCRFRDCHHESEPGCALLQAVDEELISQERFISYKRIVETLSEL
ncbi:small ribosomal subunit biogenesis GTPase RsgA [Oceanobacter sp. 4_MG-2023]|uniref:small ribosomal subunit biogenesis GTPase RsgA n=1 Tax=Oceanobacter sp. 4_MG-2023 TaxID=3062623 RepID=UPI0027373679|nr:small ribosomal subunit biogenesis GTPase RsgA [Oceanobacter sp. 4_MG-2023]MDP2547583.1 small ribosomal subunit biogenesis GTPase RsgA [Oceanobacter sp. 4_MG-2023]